MAKNPRYFKDLTPIDKIMDRSAKNGFLHFLSNRARLTNIWQQIVGPTVAANTTIRSFEMGRLIIKVPGPAYLEQYQYECQNWIKRINIEFGDEVVTKIVLRVGQS
ncbi:MAG: DUF721 domain-containing protein [Deltaproteobacteria bacterium]|jgi:hypothetical protein|nr:DUF721 domain-containing protein [Deltaproteobacteria bacterium]